MNRQSLTLAAVILGSTTVFLDATVINVALEAIGSQIPSRLFGVLEGQSYIVTAYLLALASVLILAGAMADLYGRRRMFLIGLAGFAAASALCGLAPSMEVLIGFRLVQGIFGAFLVPTSLAIISVSFSGSAAGRAYGIWTAASSVAFLVGPALGGLVIDLFSWRVVFLLNLPLAAAAAALALRYVDESRDEQHHRRLDWLGAATVAVAVGGLAFGAIRGQQSNWSDPVAWSAVVIGALSAIALVPLMRLRPDPLIPPSLFSSATFRAVNLSTLLIYGTIAVNGTTLAIFLQGTLGYSALASGLTSIPAGLLLALLSTTVGGWAARLGPRWFLVVGPLLMAGGFGWLARMPVGSPAWPAKVGNPASLVPPGGVAVDLLPALVLVGLGMALLVAPLTQALMGSVAAQYAGLGSAINNAVSRVGPLLALALVFVGVTAVFYSGLGDRLPGIDTLDPVLRANIPPLSAPLISLSGVEAAAVRASSTDAYHLAVLVNAVLCVAAAAVNGIGLRPRGMGHSA